ncbi:MAG: GNAT family N-acetyltransferase [Candidatus Marinimicrobia bacterium]|nr:GNAT family N-acetyltransferase [Candidatus Neomarinimicrobiota bacterium]MBL7009732.1 GNAT family N-acetyltransferase [Candidatus Neomarinimicrobiota bacterium]MBL7029864.1 GNAT family N-acetyltransferase [Candidatus Neomarinimicrobiota bacterium]
MVNQVQFREARITDLNTIVKMLADDDLGASRERYESPVPSSYSNAFESINKDPNNTLLLALLNDEIVGVLQLTFIPNLTYQGSWRSMIEGVRVSTKFRSKGIGQSLIQEAIRQSKAQGCRMVQLTTDKTRPDAIRFYESLGFISSHEGMKLHL